MKFLVLIFIVFISISCSKDVQFKDKIVEASCGQCQFQMSGDGCTLAIRMDSVSYYVEGTDIDDHGNALAEDGFCNAIRSAKISGSIVSERFVIQSFELIHDQK